MASDESLRIDAEKAAPATDKPISSRGSLNTLIPDIGNATDTPDKGEEQVHENVLQLAQRFTTQSQGGGAASLFPLAVDGPLDPNGPQFNAKQWAKAFYQVRKESLEGNPPKTTGIAFQNLNVYGFGSDTDFQKSVGNIFLEAATLAKKLSNKKQERVNILYDLEGVVHSGEMLCVLGPPGSGCTTFLKTVAGDTHGFHVQDSSTLNYQGIHPDQIRGAFRGEALYTAEVDHHFPQLTVGDTLYFAAATRCPKNIPAGVTRKEYVEHLRDVTMAMFGISHTRDTRVGDDFIRGVSGGERKRVTIAEASLSYSPLQCWDNSTRGLDSANAVEFCRTLRTQADVMGCTSCVAIYQAPQDAYDLFEKVLVLYKGRQIFFGKASRAQAYFEELGFMCPEQQTTPDFLTSMTSPQERIIRPGWENKTPRTPEDFARAWKESSDHALLLKEIEDYVERHPFHGDHYNRFLESRRTDQSSSQRANSPFTLSYLQQMSLTLWRSTVMLKNDPSLNLTMLVTNFLQAIIVGSIFYNLPETTASFQSRAIFLFFLILMNAFSSILEIINLYAKRKIIEKHARYALYHPSAEALSSMIVDLPYKIINAVITNITMYFMGNLRREPGPFFFFLLLIFTTTMTMSMLFRLIGSVTKSIAQAMAPSAIILLCLVLYNGFTIPTQYMRSWISWVRWANPLFYGLESVMINEFAGRDFSCANYIPSGMGYDDVLPNGRACATQGSLPGQNSVSGTTYLNSAFGYETSHRWRNLGVMLAFMVLYLALHLVASEHVASERSKGEVLVFLRKAMKHFTTPSDIESGPATLGNRHTYDGNVSGREVERQTSVFHWKDVCYDIKIKEEARRILDQVDGWVKPGTLTALMGSSGAGKTTLLDVLASRVTMGVVSGEMLVNGSLRDMSFQRKTGYVQQQDLHLHTSTVREALTFGALLRQPSQYSRQEKLDYVDTVINLLSMEDYADAIIGVPGEGLNVEQRKRLTIVVELAARPQLLLFFDEPTSGLDSQTSWSICNLMEKLTKSGQAILCTIHQPSAMLFQRFDRLLLLSSGKTIYFGDIGKDSHILVDYFTRNGAHDLPTGSNPAEYMLDVIGAAPGATTQIDWPQIWRNSSEYQLAQGELGRLAATVASEQPNKDASIYKEFAASTLEQHRQVIKRVFEQYWRSPGYIYSKVLLAIGTSLFIGLSFLNGDNTQRGLTNQMFGVFIFLSLFPQLVNQIMPVFASQRVMYEARERPSKAYSWKAFMAANMLVEVAWNSFMSVFCYVCWYFPIGLYKNAKWTDAVGSRGIAMFLHLWIFFMFASTFAHMMIAGLPSAEIAGGAMNLLLIMMFTFCGVLAGPDALPGFWIFMYRINPFTYIIESLLGTSLGNAPMYCASNEFVRFSAPNGSTCAEYTSGYLSQAGGYLADPDSTDCRYCTISETNTFLASVNVSFEHRWRDFGLMWVFCIFNVFMAMFFYWLARVPKNKKAKKE